MKIVCLFNTSGIVREPTRAEYLIQELDHEGLLCARDSIVLQPPPNDIYSQIKIRILSYYAVSLKRE